MIRIVICDDDLTFTDKIYSYLEKNFPDAKIDTYHSGTELMEGYQDTYDVAFLDIQLPDISGFDIANRLAEWNRAISIIFISSYEEKVYEAFRYRPLRFIRKSHMEDEIQEAVEAVKENRKRNECFYDFTDTTKKIRRTNVNDIIYFESNKHYVNVVKRDGTFVIREKITKLEEDFKKYNFVRIQIGFIVNMRYIRSISGYSLKLDDGTVISIGRSNQTEVKEMYMKYARRRFHK